jgi:hypothetical protein
MKLFGCGIVFWSWSFGGTFTFSNCHIIGLDTGRLVLIVFVYTLDRKVDFKLVTIFQFQQTFFFPINLLYSIRYLWDQIHAQNTCNLGPKLIPNCIKPWLSGRVILCKKYKWDVQHALPRPGEAPQIFFLQKQF